MNIIAFILALAAAVYDWAKDAVSSLANPFFLGLVAMFVVAQIIINHIDRRMDRIEKRLDALDRSEYD